MTVELWGGEDELVERVLNPVHPHEKFAFVVGSACSMPLEPGQPGVPNVDGFVALAREQLRGSNAEANLEAALASDSADRYQAVMGCLQQELGEEGVDQIVFKATTQSLQPQGAKMPRYALDENKKFRVPMDEVPECWWLPPAAKAIGRIIAENGIYFGTDVLTTNFDPLLEMAIASRELPFARIALDEDGDLNAFGGTACRVIHLHGYWRATKTLHTPKQLTKSRPRLRESLQELLHHRTVIVVGYGGWDDVLMRALTEATLQAETNMRVLWLFYENSVGKVKDRKAHVLQALAPLLEKERAEFYCGINAHKVMPALATSLANKAAVLRLSLRHYIYEAFGIEPDAVGEWDESVRESLPWRDIVEHEFETTRAALEKIKSGVLKQHPDTTPERLANVWFENLLVEKYRFVPPQWRREESSRF